MMPLQVVFSVDFVHGGTDWFIWAQIMANFQMLRRPA